MLWSILRSSDLITLQFIQCHIRDISQGKPSQPIAADLYPIVDLHSDLFGRFDIIVFRSGRIIPPDRLPFCPADSVLGKNNGDRLCGNESIEGWQTRAGREDSQRVIDTSKE